MNTGEYKWVEIIDAYTTEPESWYKIGEKYEVKPYRHNPTTFYEVRGWNGIIDCVNGGTGDNTNHRFWIYIKHTKEIEPPVIDDKLFVIE